MCMYQGVCTLERTRGSARTCARTCAGTCARVSVSHWVLGSSSRFQPLVLAFLSLFYMLGCAGFRVLEFG